jgi:hypothetical protein
VTIWTRKRGDGATRVHHDAGVRTARGGRANPMHRSAVRVARCLASVVVGPDAEAAVATLTKQAELVDSLSAPTPLGTR